MSSPGAATSAPDVELPRWWGALQPLSREADPDLWSAWSRLASQSPPHLRPEFMALEAPIVAAGDRLVAVAREVSDLKGALPLLRRGRALESYSSDHTPEYDYVGDPDALEAIWRTLLAERNWDRVVLEKLPTTSALVAHLPDLALRHGCVASLKPSFRSPYFVLPGFESRLSPKLRQNLRRWRRQLGEVELERVSSYRLDALQTAFDLEAMAWKGDAGTSIASSTNLRDFYCALAEMAADHDELDLYFLRARGRALAFLLSLRDGRTLYALKIGYDPAFARFGPGHVLLAEVARDAEARGLVELDLLGKADEWKRRWTTLTHDHVTMVIYRPTLRGAGQLLGREMLKPRLPERWLDRLRRARGEIAGRRRHCQRNDLVGRHGLLSLVVGRIRQGIGLRSGLRRVLAAPRPQARRLGAASRFAVGDWVTVRDPEQVRATLDGEHRLRGLAFVPAQWHSCGHSYRVQKVVRRIVDDHRQMRAVGRTVLLEGVTCDGRQEGLGCGRHCPLLFRDDWLEPASQPVEASGAPEPPAPSQLARVRPVDVIEATLDEQGRLDGVTFMPEMVRFAGRSWPVACELSRVFELDRWSRPLPPVYLLEGAHCEGAILGEDGPCDRSCPLLWHAAWLAFEE